MSDESYPRQIILTHEMPSVSISDGSHVCAAILAGRYR